MIDADVNLKVTSQLVEAVRIKAVGAKLVEGEKNQRFYIRLITTQSFEISISLPFL